LVVQGGWTDEVKIYEMKLKLSGPVRNWRANLDPKISRKWKPFLKEFREMYCKAKTSGSERYYTMIQKKSESPLEFYYRLNKVADKAGIKFDSSTKQRERHLKVFIKKLTDSRLRTTLQGQRLHRLSDVEYVRKQHEEMNQDDDTDTPASRRDFRADNVARDLFRPKRSGRAYTVQEESDPEDEDEKQVRFSDAVEEVPVQESAMVAAAAPSPEAASASVSKSEDLSEVVLRVLEYSSWRPPPAGDFRSEPPSPRFGSPNANKFCDNCKQFGHPTESCWADIECDQCHRMGHPARACRTRPCTWCNKFHEGKCDEWKALQAIKTLARQGALKNLPPSILKQLQIGDVNSGGPQPSNQ